MKKCINWCMLIVLMMFMASCVRTNASQKSKSPDVIQSNQEKDVYVLTVPDSQLIMTIPKGGLLPKKNPFGASSNNPRYFLFVDQSRYLNVSGWIEPAERYPGIEKYWEGETKQWKKERIQMPQNVSFAKVDRWDSIFFDKDISDNSDSKEKIMLFSVKASWVQAGTWIDIHISTVSDRPCNEARAKLVDFMKTIQVREKKRREN